MLRRSKVGVVADKLPTEERVEGFQMAVVLLGRLIARRFVPQGSEVLEHLCNPIFRSGDSECHASDGEARFQERKCWSKKVSTSGYSPWP